MSKMNQKSTRFVITQKNASFWPTIKHEIKKNM